jgi:hypothetical protein
MLISLPFFSPPATTSFRVSVQTVLDTLQHPLMLSSTEIGSDAEAHINRLAGLCASTMSNKQSREARL